jgi:hypothetical protein
MEYISGGRDRRAELIVVGVATGQRCAIDGDVLDLASLSFVQHIAVAGELLLRPTHVLADDRPETDDSSDQQYPDQKLFNGRVQSRFLIFLLESPLERRQEVPIGDPPAGCLYRETAPYTNIRRQHELNDSGTFEQCLPSRSGVGASPEIRFYSDG